MNRSGIAFVAGLAMCTALATPAAAQQRWHGGGWNHGWHGHSHGWSGGAIAGAAILGLGAAALLGGAYAAQQPYAYAPPAYPQQYYPPPAYSQYSAPYGYPLPYPYSVQQPSYCPYGYRC